MFYAFKHHALNSVAVAAFLCASAMSASAQTQNNNNLDKLGNFQKTGVTQPRPCRRPAARSMRSRPISPRSSSRRRQDRPLCIGSGRATYRRRSARRRDVRRHAQKQGLRRHRSWQGGLRRRGQGIRTLGKLHHPERRLFLQRTGSSSSPSRIAFSISLPPEFFYESPDIAVAVVVPPRRADPQRRREAYNHTARVCRVGADKKIYV